jgi:hypothetical protein
MKRVAVFVSAQGGGIRIDWSVKTRPARVPPPKGSVPLRRTRKAAQANSNAGPLDALHPVVTLPRPMALRRFTFDWHLIATRPSRLWVRGLPERALPWPAVPLRPRRPANIAAPPRDTVPAWVRDRIRMIEQRVHSRGIGSTQGDPA